ncbi:hypothetical protein TWF481_005894 [Arthrobotrys musiformis]|uniref:Uncharacterized protein n=1 Tax=Arthrobotrys musiformis TaxID=47236 RepID=A0AAV9WF60_9PEZI
MGAVGAQVPSNFEAYGLCYEPAVSSTTSSASSTTTPVSTNSIISGSSSSASSSLSSSATVSDVSSSTLPETSSDISCSSSTFQLPSPPPTSSSQLSSSPSSSSSSTTTLNAYDVITLRTLYSFCSNLLRSTQTSTSTTATTSTSTEISTQTFTSSEVATCTSSFSEYSSTSYIPTETTATDLRRKRATVVERQSSYRTPTPLTSFNDAEVRAGCSSAITIPTTTVESTDISVSVIPYLSTTDFNTTMTSYATETTTSTIPSVLTSIAVANGYYKMKNDSLGDFDNYYFYVNPKNHTGTLPDTTIVASTIRETFWQAVWDGNLGGWKMRYDWWRIGDGNNITDSFWLLYFTTITNPQKIQYRWLGLTKNTNVIGPGKTTQYALFDINDGYATIQVSLDGTRNTLWTCEDGGTAERPPAFWFYASAGWMDIVDAATDGPNGDGQYTLHNCVVVPGFHILGW